MSILNKITAAAGVVTNLDSAATTKAAGEANALIAQEGVKDATLRQIGLNNAKEQANYMKVASAAGVSASGEASRTASQ